MRIIGGRWRGRRIGAPPGELVRPTGDRMREAWPTARLVHLPIHASWLNQIEIYFWIVQRKVLTPNDFPCLEAVAERLGWEPSAIHARSCILVVSIGGKQAGFLVDEVNDIVGISRAEIQPAPEVETIEASVIDGLVRITTRAKDGTRDENGTMVLLLDLEALSLTKHLDMAA